MPRGIPKKKWEAMQRKVLEKKVNQVIDAEPVPDPVEDRYLKNRGPKYKSFIVQIGQPWMEGSKTTFIQDTYDPIEQVMKDWSGAHPDVVYLEISEVKVVEVLHRGKRKND